MVKLIVAAALVVVITSSSAIAGIMLTHAAFARNSAINAGVLVDEAQSFRLAAKAPLSLRLVRPEQTRFRSHPCNFGGGVIAAAFLFTPPSIASTMEFSRKSHR